MKRKHYKMLAAALVLAAIAVLAFRMSGTGQTFAGSEDVKKTASIPPIIHWHPRVFIFINGNQSIIPANIGIYNRGEAPIHTHDDSGILHIEQEFSAYETLKLGYFFHDVWNQAFNSTCVFDYCTNSTHEISFWVNKKRNYYFDNLVMHDGDIIVIIYSKSYSIVSSF